MSFNIDELKNKDIKSMTLEELNDYGSYVQNTRKDASKIYKSSLLKIIYNVVASILGVVIGILIFNCIMCFIYDNPTYKKYLALILVCCVIIFIPYFLWNRSEKKVTELTNICNDKLDEIRKQRNLLELKATMAQEKAERAKQKAETEKSAKAVEEKVENKETKPVEKENVAEKPVEETKKEETKTETKEKTTEKTEQEEQKKVDEDKKKDDDIAALSKEIQELKELLKKQSEKSNESKEN